MSRVLRASRRSLLVVCLVLAALLAAETVALAVTVVKSGGPVRSVKVATDAEQVSTLSPTWSDVPGMSVTMWVPSGEKGLFIATFSGQTYCQEQSAINAYIECYIRVLVDGSPALPGDVVASQAYNQTSELYSAHSMQFVAGPLGAGQHTIKVQYRATTGLFNIGARTLTVMRSKV